VKQLAPRHLAVLRLCEFTNREIALLLRTKLQVIKNYWRGVYQRLGVDGPGHCKRTRAVMLALRQGHIALSEIVQADLRREVQQWH
jgi:DNA-binding NarL/FixJ family response regulator